jgi:hypothetical protein
MTSSTRPSGTAARVGALAIACLLVATVAACGRSHRYSRAAQDADAQDVAPDGSEASDGRAPEQGCMPGPGNGGTGPGDCTPVRCGGILYECGDCMDNDEDGLIDSDDPECAGPCDHSEAYFLGEIFGDPVACVTDCVFDADVSVADDGCSLTYACDGRAEPLCAQNESVCAVSVGSQCPVLCGPITPIGCDCFGCCELPPGSGLHVWIGREKASTRPRCSLATLDDPEACPPCTPMPECYKPCGECDLCLGKRELPASCDPCERCPEGRQPCGLPGEARCPEGEWCITGCCVASPYFNTSPT